LHAPTGVTHSVSAFLSVSAPAPGTPADASPLPNLVVVRSTSLEVYAANRIQEGSSASNIKLELLAQQRLFGVVESLAVLKGRSGRSGRDAILLTFRDAKLSVLQWDPFTSDMVPSSLHYFEGDESLKAGRQAFPRPPIAVTDPAGRCAAVVMLRHQLAVLPATESESASLGMGDDPYALGANFGTGSAAAAAGETVAAALGNSYVDNLSKMNIREVRDAVFLFGAAEPTLLILHEGEPTWAGNLRLKKDSCALTALSLNLSAKRHPKIWGAQNVPYDAYKIVSVPSGGALVFCTACILYYSQGQQAGVVLHSAAIPAAQAPPPLAFDLTKEAPSVAAAKYAREHATELHPLAASACIQFCDVSTAGWNLECDAAHAVWLSKSTAMVGLKTGQLLLVEVVRLGGGTVKIRVAKAGAAPVASAMTVLSPSVAFIGSCAGDSLLIGCTLSTNSTTSALAAKKSKSKQSEQGDDEEAPDTKRRRLESADADHVKKVKDTDTTGDKAAIAAGANEEGKEANNEDESEDEEALLLYGAEGDDANDTTAGASTVRCSLRVLDSFISIGPVRSLTSSTSGASGTEAPYLVTCCGKDKGGALAVVRRSVAPDVMTEVPLPHVIGSWAVGNNNKNHHSYLLLSYPDRTTVLATGGEELQEVTQTVEFARDTPTIGAGTVAEGTRIVQAFAQGVRVLDENGLQRQALSAASDLFLHHKSTTKTSSGTESLHIASMNVLDPFVLLQMTDGTAVVLQVDENTLELVHSTSIITIADDDGNDVSGIATLPPVHVTACCLYKDTCGWLQRHFLKSADSDGSNNSNEMFLCVACFSDGSVSMWQLLNQSDTSTKPSRGSNLASMKPLWRCGSFSEVPMVLIGGTIARAAGAAGISALTNADTTTSGSTIVEVRFESFNSPTATRSDLTKAPAAAAAAAAPILVALSADDTVVAYKAFTCGSPTTVATTTIDTAKEDAPPSIIEDSLRFKRLYLDIPAILPTAATTTTSSTTATNRTPHYRHQKQQRLFSFIGLGEQIPHSGFFISGASPVWLIASRGTLFSHPLHLESKNRGVSGFTSFNTMNSPHGFITVHHSSSSTSDTTNCIQIAGLPLRQRLDAPWPRQKIAIKATPHKICLYPEAHLFALAASRTTKYRPFLPEEDGGEPQASYSYALADAAAAARGMQAQQHEIRLVQPGTWATLWQYALLPGEIALSLETVHLRDATTGATFPLLALGVGFNAGEDYPCSGRVLLFEVIHRTPNNPSKNNKSSGGGGGGWTAELIYAREFKGPVTGVATMEGNLLISTGNRLEICTLSTTSRALEGGDDDTTKIKTTYKLTRSAFYDGPTIITNLCVVKTFALASDAAFSVQFIRYSKEGHQLAVLGKDFGRACVRAAQFLISGSSLHLVSADAAGTIQTFTYAPNDATTWKGTKLLPWGVMHVGEGVGAMTRVRMPQPSSSDTTVRQAVLYGSDTGALGAIMPLSIGEHLMQPTAHDATFLSALRALQREIATSVSHGAGLNPFAFRRRHGKIPPGLEGNTPYGGVGLALEKQGLFDGDLLMRFMWLPRAMQVRVAGRAGVTRNEVLEVLAAIARTSCLI
jgi:cleavage and polyadenylation specificity factor subunit 1